MEKIVFTSSWKQIFEEQGLNSFDDFYHIPGGRCVNKNKRRDVYALQLKIGGEIKNLYLKRFHKPYLKDILFTWLNCGKILSQAAYEWTNINLLKKNNIETSNPVCYGEKLQFGIENKSFILVEELKGQCLADFVTQNWDDLPQLEKEIIITSLAQKIRMIHKAGIGMTDLYIWHIFISENGHQDGSRYNFSFIDLNRMKHRSDKNEKIKNLGRLYYSMSNKYFDKQMLRLLLESYIGNKNAKKTEEFIRKVKKHSAKISAMKRPKPY